MARNKERPKYVTELVVKVNRTLRCGKVKDESNDLFMFMVQYLLDKKMYKGFNFYKDKTFECGTLPILAGTADKDKYDYLQLY